eukprot:TRINITY_DN1724_c0_g1_i10.p1 TRINITY_DN1724_c0_g1~~TRINITY_DN1724_c0_g1_i10.p1  ORF type:complete len:208 (+),score=35.65 TRINITY_DN1724_c0_g1_i10:84-707(+)
MFLFFFGFVFFFLFFFFFFFKQKTAYEIMPSLVGSEMCIRDSKNILFLFLFLFFTISVSKYIIGYKHNFYLSYQIYLYIYIYLYINLYNVIYQTSLVISFGNQSYSTNFFYIGTTLISKSGQILQTSYLVLTTQYLTVRTILLRYLIWIKFPCTCLLYTSDAADDMQCVDLGGRRIIKKKKKNKVQHYNNKQYDIKWILINNKEVNK